ncbi:unnamed protein product [Pseudo-nitzschia multistriata]|uniref:Uncharacterized protein n=1 Tax=Pseudo-nitzschia multistriata TaxID=183589 RepID=A0A448YZ12_9STRA|nr:unnamed protein product [Pseudo-nitzschia multistriata]
MQLIFLVVPIDYPSTNLFEVASKGTKKKNILYRSSLDVCNDHTSFASYAIRSMEGEERGDEEHVEEELLS